MVRVRQVALTGAVVIAALALIAAQQPAGLAQSHGGLWEISGVPGAKEPLKECVTAVAALAQFEHRGKTCAPKIISAGTSTTVIEYTCGAAGFGRSKVDVITPRSLRIETQGISEQLPFSYVLQARRVGDCPAQVAASRH